MTKAEIVEVIASGTGLTKVETAAVIDGFLATVSYALQNGDRVELRGFGTFCLRESQNGKDDDYSTPGRPGFQTLAPVQGLCC